MDINKSGKNVQQGKMFRQKKYICGPFMDVEIIQRPEQAKKYKRARRTKASSPAQKNLNDKNARKYLVRLVHTNFTEKDLFVDLTFANKCLPESREKVLHELRKYISRLNYWCKKNGREKIKYIYVISNMDQKSDRQTRFHVHMIISGVDRDIAEQKWQKGYANTQRLKFDEHGVTGKVLYMARQSGNGGKRWGASTGLKKPELIISDKAVTRSAAERMMRCPDDRRYFERRYPGWTFTDCVPEYQESLVGDGPGLSITIHMRRC